ncbi:MAG: hypothetical protein HZB46_09730 [Solirubrobacterales bacterium]|nr:hypothetical protein [Solirubrobacterales bacterium]
MSAVRAALHVHSTWSYDGSWELATIARRFALLGYDAVLLAEHDKGYDEARWRALQEACAAASTPKLVLVPGIEYSDADNTVHVPVWGVGTPFLGEGRPTLETLQRAREAGAVSMLAHPARKRAHERVTGEWLELLCAVETWNGKYDGWTPSAIAGGLRERAPHLQGLFGLDFHLARQLLPLAMVGEVDGPVTAAAVVEALGAGALRPDALGLGPDWALSRHGRAVTGAVDRSRRRTGKAVRRVRAKVRR